ncbi:hypothetical protein C0J52_04112 [Blattella germanica]|nr:hypothetical protein C0J52_04112 [Blattella germanica]PSN55062.1 hypothetical protein C0J52_04112 [Blattella germanica]
MAEYVGLHNFVNNLIVRMDLIEFKLIITPGHYLRIVIQLLCSAPSLLFCYMYYCRSSSHIDNLYHISFSLSILLQRT